MQPDDPAMAQQVVAAYASVLEQHYEQQQFPASRSALPYAPDVIKTAIRTSALALSSTGQMTDELRAFLEDAYVALADFVDDELARLMHEYNRAADELATTSQSSGERVKSAHWQTLQRSSALAGEIAKTMADDAARLRAEFRALGVG